MNFLTNLIFEPKGKHDSTQAYSIKDTVMSADGIKVYFAIKDVPAGIALTNTNYWKLQIDLSAPNAAMQNATDSANNAIANFGNYAKEIGLRVKGETANAVGNPVTFLPDAGSLLQPVTVFSPVQTGRGDPYPAGGGKNLLPVTATTQNINGVTFTVNNGVITANGTASATAYFQLSDEFTLPAGTYMVSGIPDDIDYNTVGGFFDDNWNLNRYGVTTLTEEAVIKPYIRINSGQTANSIVFKLQLEAGSTATDFVPYSNIRPISGWNVLSLTAAGKNLAPPHNAFPSGTGVAFTQSGGGLKISGTPTTNVRIDSPKITLPPGSYALMPNPSALIPGAVCYCRGNDGKQYGSISLANSLSAKGAFTLTESTELCVSVYFSSGQTVESTLKIQLNPGTAAMDFEPYAGNTYTVQIGQTVYGGRFDWLTGKLTIDMALAVYNGTESWEASNTSISGKSRFYAPGTASGILPPPDTSTTAEGFVCSHYKAAPSTTGGPWQCVQSVGVYTSGAVYFYDDRYAESTADEWKAFLAAQYAAGTPVQIAYKLATPTTIQLTPQIISAVAPEQTNTLYGDGNIEVEFVKPLHVSIDERVAAAVQAALAEATTE